MNKDALEQILNEYSIKNRGIERYYERLAHKFALEYIEKFTIGKIMSLVNISGAIPFSRLNLKETFCERDADDLLITDNLIFYVNSKPLLEMDSKFHIINIWTNEKKERFNTLIHIEDYLGHLKENEINSILESLKIYNEHRTFLSIFYRYVLCLLEEKADIYGQNARIGLFKNAYFDVLNYEPLKLEELKR